MAFNKLKKTYHFFEAKDIFINSNVWLMGGLREVVPATPVLHLWSTVIELTARELSMEVFHGAKKIFLPDKYVMTGSPAKPLWNFLYFNFKELAIVKNYHFESLPTKKWLYLQTPV